MRYTGKLWFFDSWIGWLTVMEAFRKYHPNLEIVYFGDRSNCPYGDRSSEEIRSLVEAWVERLVEEGCTMVILACNTAVAHSVAYLQQQKYPAWGPIKILGVTLPGAEKVARCGYGHVGVLATAATVRNRAYRERVHLLDPNIRISEVAVPWLVNAIEKELWITSEIQELLHGAISNFEPETEALILGCTHYPIVREEIYQTWLRIHGSHIDIIDPGEEAAAGFSAYLERHPEFELTQGSTPPKIIWG